MFRKNQYEEVILPDNVALVKPGETGALVGSQRLVLSFNEKLAVRTAVSELRPYRQPSEVSFYQAQID